MITPCSFLTPRYVSASVSPLYTSRVFAMFTNTPAPPHPCCCPQSSYTPLHEPISVSRTDLGSGVGVKVALQWAADSFKEEVSSRGGVPNEGNKPAPRSGEGSYRYEHNVCVCVCIHLCDFRGFGVQEEDSPWRREVALRPRDRNCQQGDVQRSVRMREGYSGGLATS